MASDKKERPKRYVTPTGIAQWPRLTGKPDTKFKPEGIWSVKLTFSDLSAPGVQEMIDRLEATIEQAKRDALADTKYISALKAKGKKPTPAERSFFVNEETGELTINFKMTASGISKKTNEPWSRRPAVFNKDGTPADPNLKLGSGSELQVSYTAEPFHTAVGYGVSLRLEAVRVIKAVEWTGGDAASYGFEAEMEEQDEDAETAMAESGGDAGDSGDF